MTGKHLRWSLFLNKVSGLRPTLNKVSGLQLYKTDSNKGAFPVNFVKLLRTPFLQNTSRRRLLTCNSTHSFILQRHFIYLFKPSLVRKIDKKLQFFHFIYVVFYRSNHKHKKSFFINEIFIK